VNIRDARLIVITDATVAAEDVIEERITRVLAMARAGSVVVQLRDKDLPARWRLALGERLVAACRQHGQWFVVNDRIDLAVLLGADGVHLGEESVSTEDARALLPRAAWVSRACHEPEGVGTPEGRGVDAWLLSPVAAPRKGRVALGESGVERARAVIDRMDPAERPRLFALGGVRAKDVATWMAAGAHGVAVIGAVLNGQDPRALVDALEIAKA
jgi:thiamine-phosphate pyrophosphorylase